MQISPAIAIAFSAIVRASSCGIFHSMPVSLTYPSELRREAASADLIHIHLPFPLADFALLLRGSGRPPLVASFHSDIHRQKIAKSFYLPAVNVHVTVESDGTLAIEERISFVFDGSFSGAYRDIPLRDGERISDVSVEENGLRYAPGASAELGSSGVPNTFGETPIDRGHRIVWHFQAFNELRTFTVGYRLSNLAIAFDDVVDVDLNVWGDQWDQTLQQLTAELTLPGPASGPSWRVWGHPVSVRGDVTRGPDSALLRAVDIPPKQFVELRAVFPRSLLTSTGGAKVRRGDALPRIVAEEAANAAAFEEDQERIRSALDGLETRRRILS